jgi:hypothetical protein
MQSLIVAVMAASPSSQLLARRLIEESYMFADAMLAERERAKA